MVQTTPSTFFGMCNRVEHQKLRQMPQGGRLVEFLVFNLYLLSFMKLIEFVL